MKHCVFFSFPKLVVSEAIHHPNVRVQAGKNGGWTTRTGWNRCNPWSCLKHFQCKNFIQFFGKFQQFGRTPRHVPIASDPLISLTILWQPRWIPPFFKSNFYMMPEVQAWSHVKFLFLDSTNRWNDYGPKLLHDLLALSERNGCPNNDGASSLLYESEHGLFQIISPQKRPLFSMC